MSAICSEVISYLETLFPKELKESYDNVGLLVGSPEMMVNKVLVCLDITDEVISEAAKIKAQLIISHHPIIFKPIKNIIYDKKPTSNLVKIINEGINIYSLHTNFDNAFPGMNDVLANVFQLNNIGKFLSGTGRYGDLSNIETLKDFAKRTKQILGADSVRFCGDPLSIIRRVGIVGGSGSDFIGSAIDCQCDVLITGDIKHHDALDAVDRGIALIDGSHYYTELIFIRYISELLNRLTTIEVISTTVNTNPFRVI